MHPKEIEEISEKMNFVASRFEREIKDALGKAQDYAIEIFLAKPRTAEEQAKIEELVAVSTSAVERYREKLGKAPLTEVELRKIAYLSIMKGA